MARVTKFSVGQKWLCTPKDGRPPFYFVIVGPPTYGISNPKTSKGCRLELVKPEDHSESMRQYYHHGMLNDYPHEHLKKYAVWVPQPA